MVFVIFIRLGCIEYVLFSNLEEVSGCRVEVITEEHVCVISCLCIISNVNTAIQSEKSKNRNELTFQMFQREQKELQRMKRDKWPCFN